MCRGASLHADVSLTRLPLLSARNRSPKPESEPAEAKRNWTSYGHEVTIPAAAPEWWRGVLCDPQTAAAF